MKNVPLLFKWFASLLIFVITAWTLNPVAAQAKKTEKQQSQKPIRSAVTVESARSRYINNITKISVLGTVKSNRNIMLTSQVSGVIKAVHVSSGQQVTEGQVIISLESGVLNAEKKMLEADLMLAKLNFEREAQLAEKSLSSLAELDKVMAQYEQVKARLEAKREQIRLHHISAPFSGIVGVFDTQLGEHIQAGKGIMPLQNRDQLYIDFVVPRSFITAISYGQKVQVSSQHGHSSSALIKVLDTSVNAKSLGLNVRAYLDDSRGFIPGDAVDVAIVKDHHEQVLVVPEQAIKFSSYGESLFVLEQGVVTNQFIRTGERIGEDIVVLSGLSENQEVVIAGQSKLYPGLAVNVLNKARL
ncbi:efflux RND transporter periplasmic adaptor subunit [Pseudoalteromonas aurantia]|uniref:Membrane fusion protein n=1 Tax=Pseudoalteromonas aurantia 208 TaxID=1314867 RepID=A0ABR9E605_9GAMM|nr:efflux RND transporter periplasmic adaptor subunit [Pseudoalteromonas aurantia]MBE0366415.1 membrane fusion protein [Pseudoalteromonas aurantia 208]